ncbi:hypothetical protein T03_16473 [Trichinella britovi]|uniref:Uncharacterized protein n=1 Tax=Trichinella britovi TaxID=45882 RepID=A0A0V1DF55_TRIBR|nr:hypothetical protein T03_16473 [Trichinella britovi]
MSKWASLNSSASHFPQTPPPFCDWLYSDRLHTIDRCVKLYAQQHFTSCFISVLPLTPVLIITESISVSIFCSFPSSPESRIHQNFSRQISDDDV